MASLACAARPQSGAESSEVREGDELSRIRAAVEKALDADPPRGYEAIPSGVRLLSVTEDANGAIVLNLSGELLTRSTRVIEDSLRQILSAASAAREPRPGRVDEFKVLVNGVMLQSYLP